MGIHPATEVMEAHTAATELATTIGPFLELTVMAIFIQEAALASAITPTALLTDSNTNHSPA